LLVVKPFKENLGSPVLGGKLASYILWKNIPYARVQPLNLHQKLVVVVVVVFNQNLNVRQGKGITSPMKLVISGYLNKHWNGRMN
jgi:hypothetical protein